MRTVPGTERRRRRFRYAVGLAVFFLFLTGVGVNSTSGLYKEYRMHLVISSAMSALQMEFSHLFSKGLPENKTLFSDDFYAALGFFRVTTAQNSLYVQGDVMSTSVTGEPDVKGVERMMPRSMVELDELKPGREGMQQQLSSLPLRNKEWGTWPLHVALSSRGPAMMSPEFHWKKFYIAINFYKNENLIPFFTEALVEFLTEELAPFFPLSESVVVAIYANECADDTALLINEVLIPRLQKAGVTRIYATTGGTCLGYSTRQPFHDRIEWLSCVRNKAMEPLMDMGMRVFLEDPLVEIAAEANDEEEENLVVIFFNDIFFTPKDITVLLETRVEPEMKPGFPIDGELPIPVAVNVTDTPMQNVNGFDMACAMDFYYTLYDTWVNRDGLGNPISNMPPYFVRGGFGRSFWSAVMSGHRSPEDTVISRNGTVKDHRKAYGVPVKSCWNGVVAIRGKFFLPPKRESVRHRLDRFSALSSGPSFAVDVIRQRPSEASYPLLLGRNGLYNVVRKSGTAENHFNRDITGGESEFPRYLRRPSGTLLEKRSSVVSEAADYWKHTYAIRSRKQVKKLFEDSSVCFTEDDPVYCASEVGVDYLVHILRTESNESGKSEWFPASQFAESLTDQVRGVGEMMEDHQSKQEMAVYEEVYPVLRFRDSSAPSYGSRLLRHTNVSSSVCKSSECLLLSEDMSQLVYFQERRTPVILMNPNVRVAYDIEFYHRIQDGRMFQWFCFFIGTIRPLYEWAVYMVGMDFISSWREPLPIDGVASWYPSASVSIRDDWSPNVTDVDLVFSPIRQTWLHVNLTDLFLLRCHPEPIHVFQTSKLLWRMGVLVCLALLLWYTTCRKSTVHACPYRLFRVLPKVWRMPRRSTRNPRLEVLLP